MKDRVRKIASSFNVANIAFRVAGIGGDSSDSGRTSILRKKFREEKDRSEWALMDSKGERVLKWFGPEKPSKERVMKEERRIQYFKHKRSSGTQGEWVPAAGGTEEPFLTRGGRKLQYMWNPVTKEHAYLDLETDLILSDEEARAILGSSGGSPGKDWIPGMASDDPITSMVLRCASGDLVRIRVTEDPNTVTVEYLGRTHSAVWDDDENLTDVVGDENLLRAAMIAWDGSEQMEISADDLAKAGGGWWAP